MYGFVYDYRSMVLERCWTLASVSWCWSWVIPDFDWRSVHQSSASNMTSWKCWHSVGVTWKCWHSVGVNLYHGGRVNSLCDYLTGIWTSAYHGWSGPGGGDNSLMGNINWAERNRNIVCVECGVYRTERNMGVNINWWRRMLVNCSRNVVAGDYRSWRTAEFVTVKPCLLLLWSFKFFNLRGERCCGSRLNIPLAYDRIHWLSNWRLELLHLLKNSLMATRTELGALRFVNRRVLKLLPHSLVRMDESSLIHRLRVVVPVSVEWTTRSVISLLRISNFLENFPMLRHAVVRDVRIDAVCVRINGLEVWLPNLWEIGAHTVSVFHGGRQLAIFRNQILPFYLSIPNPIAQILTIWDLLVNSGSTLS